MNLKHWARHEPCDALSVHKQTQATVLQGLVFHLTRNANYLCIVCCVVCLFDLVESWDRDQGRWCRWHSSCLPPHYLRPSLSHLALKRRNVFKASSSFTGALTTSLHADVASAGCLWVCQRGCVCARFLGHGMLLFLTNLLDGEMCCLKSGIYCRNERNRLKQKYTAERMKAKWVHLRNLLCHAWAWKKMHNIKEYMEPINDLGVRLK